MKRVPKSSWPTSLFPPSFLCVYVHLKSQQEIICLEGRQRIAPLSLMNQHPGWKGSYLPLNWAPQALSASHPVPTEHSQTLYVKASHSLPWPSSPTECQTPGGHSPATLLALRLRHTGTLASLPFSVSQSFHSPSLLPGQAGPGFSSPAVSLKFPLHPACLLPFPA